MHDSNQIVGVTTRKTNLSDLLTKLYLLAKEGKALTSSNINTSGLEEELLNGSLLNAAVFDMVLAIPSINPDGHKEGL